MPSKLEWLNAKTIYQVLGVLARQLYGLEILTEVDSTNNYLLARRNLPGTYAVLAEGQTAGRGRCDRRWISPFGKNIYLSLAWPWTNRSGKLPGLSLAIGIGVIHALEDYGLTQVGLKWPNDIIYAGKKLGGILIEINSHHSVPQIIIGIGLNVHNPQSGPFIDYAWTDIFSIKPEPPKRNLLTGLLLKHLLITLISFQQTGFKPFIHIWHSLDKLVGHPVLIKTPTNCLEGVACGIDNFGHLCVNIKGSLQYFNSAEISVRKQG